MCFILEGRFVRDSINGVTGSGDDVEREEEFVFPLSTTDAEKRSTWR